MRSPLPLRPAPESAVKTVCHSPILTYHGPGTDFIATTNPPEVTLSEVCSACMDVFGDSQGAQDKLKHRNRAATTESTNWASQAVLGQAELCFQSFPQGLF